MIRGPLKILKIEAVLRGETRRAPAGLWITVIGLEHEPFRVLAIGLVVDGRPDIVWINAPRRFLRRRGWTVTKKRALSICFPLDMLQLPVVAPHDQFARPEIGIESVVVSLSSGIEMRQRIHHITRETKQSRRFLPPFGRDRHTS